MLVLLCASNVADRFHGFLRSAMLNPHPGVYVAADLDAGSKDRIWRILHDWWHEEPRGTLMILWSDRKSPSGISMEVLGLPKRNIVVYDGHYALSSSGEEAGRIKDGKENDGRELQPQPPPRQRG